PKSLPPQHAGLSEATRPAIAADLTTDPDPGSGNIDGNKSGVDVVWVELLPTDEQQVVGLRSSDSGTTFSPTGVRADASASDVSDGGGPTAGVARPSIDAAYNSFTTTAPSWVMTAWDDTRSPGPGPEVWCDARFNADAVTQAPDWHVGDVRVT